MSWPAPRRVPQLSETEVRELAEGALGCSVGEVSVLPGSVGNQNFRLDTERGRFAIKLAASSELFAERWGLEQATAVGVPVTDVRSAGEGSGERGFLITVWRPGRPVAADDHAALVEVGRAVRRYHHVTGPGYGRVILTGTAPTGQHPRWADMITGVLAGLDGLARHGVLTAEVVDRFRTAVDDHRDDLAYESAGVLLHSDLKPAHLLVADGSLSAIIDWGDTSLGDPMWDLARLSHAGEQFLRPVLEGYELELDEALARRLGCYRALLHADALHYELMAGGDWFDVYRRTITDWLAQVS